MRPDKKEVKLKRKRMLIINLYLRLAKAMKDYSYYKDLPKEIYFTTNALKGGIYYGGEVEQIKFSLMPVNNEGIIYYINDKGENISLYIDESRLLSYVTYFSK